MKKILFLLLFAQCAFAQSQTSVQATIDANLVNPLRTVRIKTSVTAVNELAGKAAADAATALSQIAGLQAGQNPETDPTVPSNVKAITSTNIANWTTAYSWGPHTSAGYLTSGSSIPFANITGVPSYMLATTAASTYQTLAGMSSYETASIAGGKYQLLNRLAQDLSASTVNYPTTSAVNTGLALKANLAGGNTFTGAQVFPSTTSFGSVSSTELGYLDGVTSAIQTQLDAKLTSYTETDPTVSAAAKAITSTNVNNWNAAYGWNNHALAGYQLSSNLATDLTPSATKYPNVNTVNSALSGKADASSAAPIKYSSDLSGSYDSRTLVDKGYVDTQFASVQGNPFTSRRTSYFEPQGNGTTVNTLGLPMTAQGTATIRNVNTTGFLSRLRRVGYVGATTANSSGGIIGNATFQVLNGFTFRAVFSIQAYNSAHRYTIGMGNTSDNTVEPSTLLNRIHMYADAGDVTFKIRGAGAALGTVIDLGPNFPCNTSATDVYDVVFDVAAGGTTATYYVRRLNTGDVASGTISTVPGAGLLSAQVFGSNVASGVAASVDVARVQVTTDH